eukprot:TRINITY_DN599_c0_g1_i2.p1 TRINITY_DN599_c0_g1~~TRINITY_DN599_c0_g1_i2.p1  ORF type:complete len:690 (+),score=120.66 TRINITY_DN599_c0_g1_i2:71-2140(+)
MPTTPAWASARCPPGLPSQPRRVAVTPAASGDCGAALTAAAIGAAAGAGDTGAAGCPTGPVSQPPSPPPTAPTAEAMGAPPSPEPTGDCCLGESGPLRFAVQPPQQQQQQQGRERRPRGSGCAGELTPPHSPALTARAYAIPREGRVEDSLLRRHCNATRRAEQRRRELEELQLSELRPPELARRSRRVQRPPGAVHERLYEQAAQMARRDERERERRAEEEAAPPAPAAPSINRRSRRLARSAESLWAWDAARQERLRLRQQESAEAELTELRDGPEIDQLSVAIASGSGRRARVEEGLLLRGSEQRERIARRAAAAEASRSPPCSPRCGASERLYPGTPRTSPGRSTTPLTPRSSHAGGGNWARLALARDGAQPFQPCITPRSHVLAQARRREERSVWDGLHADCREREARQQAAAEAARAAAPRGSPRISSRSRRLAAAAREGDGVERLLRRLQQPTGRVRSRAVAELVAARESNAQFAPRLLPASEEIDRRRHPPGGDRVELLQARHRDRERRVGELRAAQQRQQEDEDRRACSRTRRRPSCSGGAGAAQDAGAGEAPLEWHDAPAAPRSDHSAIYGPDSPPPLPACNPLPRAASPPHRPDSSFTPYDLHYDPEPPPSPPPPPAADASVTTAAPSDSSAYDVWMQAIRALRKDVPMAPRVCTDETSLQSEDREFAPESGGVPRRG